MSQTGLRARNQYAVRSWKRLGYRLGEDAGLGTRAVLRAAAPATVRLRCLGPVMHRFRAAERIRCPMCQAETQVVGTI